MGSPPLDIERVKEILDEALKLPTAKRPAFLSTACGDDQALRDEVESLLGQDTGQVALLEQPAFSLLDESGEHELTPWRLKPGQKIGPYRVVRQLGEGGMGAVALAARSDDFEQRVALKLIKTTLLSTELVERFHNERQILAFLEHPNIARILDGGTTEQGLPYFVMEYVEGEPIDAYCRRHALPIRHRLEIFLELCSALQLAHQNLVVHRDLKPHNILVTASGVPKLLDFGIAKRLTPAPAHAITQLAQGPMTLKYASPEQIANQPITTASDIYALGVLLYELLAERYPYNEEDNEIELAKAICDKEPSKPSAALPLRRTTSDESHDAAPARHLARQRRRQLAGDLDSIVLKALQKNPRLRYSSVEQLAEDIHRYLEGLPVLAREGTWMYRTSKLVRRNKGRLAAIAILMGGVVAFAVQQIRLERTRTSQLAATEETRQAEAQAEVLQEFVDLLFKASDPDIAQGQDLRVQDVLEQAEPEIRKKLATEPELLAENLENLGQIHRHLGRFDLARKLIGEAYTTRRRFHGGDADHPLLARNLNNLAAVYFELEEYRHAELLYQEALAIRQRLGQKGTDLAPIQSNLAATYLISGRYDEAKELYCGVYRKRSAEHGEDDPNVARAMSVLGKLAYSRSDFASAEVWLRRALDILRGENGSPSLIASTLSTLGRTLHADGRLDEAGEAFREALAIRQRIGGGKNLASALSQKDLAAWSCSAGRLDEAEGLLSEALATLARTRASDSWMLAETRSVQGLCLVTAGRFAEAEPHLLSSQQTLAARRGAHSIYTQDSLRGLVKLYSGWGQPEKASPYRDLLKFHAAFLDEKKESPGEECTPPLGNKTQQRLADAQRSR